MEEPGSELGELYVVVRPGKDRHAIHGELTDGTSIDGWVSHRALREVAVAMVSAWIVALAKLSPRLLPLDVALRVTAPSVIEDLERLVREARHIATAAAGGCQPLSPKSDANGQAGPGRDE